MAKFSKEIDRLVLAAQQAGWRIERSAGKHQVAYPTDPTKSPVTIPRSISDWRGLNNFRSYLRKGGLDV
jgi:hypothetical protein